MSPSASSAPPREISPSPADFLSALIQSNFNLPELAARLTPEQLLEFTTDPAIREKLETLLDFNTLCLSLRQAQARHVALNAMQTLVEESTSDLEKRRAATSLLRATSPPSPRSPGRGPEAWRGGEGSSSNANEFNDAPAPRHTPIPRYTAAQVLGILHTAVNQKDRPHSDAGLATIAAFCDDDASVNDEPLPTDHPGECIEAIADSPLTQVVGLTPDLAAAGRIPPDVSDDWTHTTIFTDRARSKVFQVLIQLRRRPDSRHPDCWLITALTVTPDPNSS